jgi:hypothetical protein
MQRETAKHVVAMYERTFREELGLTFREGIAEMCENHERQLAIWQQSPTPKKLEALLVKTAHEPSLESLKGLLDSIKLLPYLLRQVYEGETPKNRGGHPRLSSLQDDREICKQIGELLGKGLHISSALKRMAHRKRVSLRTIQRIWYGRNKPDSPHYLERTETDGRGLRFRIKVMRRPVLL